VVFSLEKPTFSLWRKKLKIFKVLNRAFFALFKPTITNRGVEGF
jgi:hypothetical protein